MGPGVICLTIKIETNEKSSHHNLLSQIIIIGSRMSDTQVLRTDLNTHKKVVRIKRPDSPAVW